MITELYLRLLQSRAVLKCLLYPPTFRWGLDEFEFMRIRMLWLNGHDELCVEVTNMGN